MIGIQIRFLAGRFHGNSWHHAHNEGISEWPPSPWRVLRALIAAGFALKLDRKDMEPVLSRLVGLPNYLLPAAVQAHTRHYMPNTDDSNHKAAKVFDCFVAVDGGAQDPQAVTIAWPTTMTDVERTMLERLASNVSYLGRCESWAELSVVDVEHCDWDCEPVEQGGANSASLMALENVDAFSEWVRNEPIPKKGQDVPRTWWDVLTFDGARYRAEGWSRVPGTRLVRYAFRKAPFTRTTVVRPRYKAQQVNVARYAIRSSVLPRITNSISLGERLREALMSQSDGAAVFSGHFPKGVHSNHHHALYLPCDDDNDGAVDHLVVSARQGFDANEIDAIQRIRWLSGRGKIDIELILIGLGRNGDYGGLSLPKSRILFESKVWTSVTPFVPTRHPKWVRGVEVDSVPEQLRRACVQFIGVEPAVELVPNSKWSRFRRTRRSGKGSKGPDCAVGARLTFETSVQGPLALGYGNHFGLGLFKAVAS